MLVSVTGLVQRRALQLRESVEMAAEREQLGLRSLFNDSAATQYDDAVCVPDGREAVGDDERSAATRQARERFLHEAFGFGVQR